MFFWTIFQADAVEDKKKKEIQPVKKMPNDGSLLKALIPYLPLPLAVVCLVFNILLPGVGKYHVLVLEIGQTSVEH